MSAMIFPLLLCAPGGLEAAETSGRYSDTDIELYGALARILGPVIVFPFLIVALWLIGVGWKKIARWRF